MRPQILYDDVVGDFAGESERKRDVESRSGRKGHHRVGDALHGVRFDLTPTIRTIRVTHSRPQQTEVVIDLGRRADCRARCLGRVFLLDGNGGRETFDRFDVRLFHPFQELPRIRRKRFDVAALTLGVDGVESQRRFSRPRRTGDDSDRASGNFEVEPLEIILSRAADDDAVFHKPKSKRQTEDTPKFRGESVAIIA